MYIELPEEIQEFATYDPQNRIIHIERTLLLEKHEGTYELVVEVEYGHSTLKKRHNITMFLILKDLALEKQPEGPTDEPSIIIESVIVKEPEIIDEVPELPNGKGFTKTNKTVYR